MGKENLTPPRKVNEFLALVERVENLEQKVFKNKKPPITLSQQILLLHYLGMLDALRQLDTSNANKAKLLARILKTDESNTKKALEAVAKKESHLKISDNYTLLRDTFEDFGLPTLAD